MILVDLRIYKLALYAEQRSVEFEHEVGEIVMPKSLVALAQETAAALTGDPLHLLHMAKDGTPVQLAYKDKGKLFSYLHQAGKDGKTEGEVFSQLGVDSNDATRNIIRRFLEEAAEVGLQGK